MTAPGNRSGKSGAPAREKTGAKRAQPSEEAAGNGGQRKDGAVTQRQRLNANGGTSASMARPSRAGPAPSADTARSGRFSVSGPTLPVSED